jgi:hypothetical protein
MVAPLSRTEDCAVRTAHDQWTNNRFFIQSARYSLPLGSPALQQDLRPRCVSVHLPQCRQIAIAHPLT